MKRNRNREKKVKLRVITVRLTEEMAARLEAEAGEEPLSVVVREAIREHFERTGGSHLRHTNGEGND